MKHSVAMVTKVAIAVFDFYSWQLGIQLTLFMSLN